jgi:phage gpG-like protein
VAQILVSVNDQQLVNGLREMIRRGSDPRGALEAVADDFLRMEAEQFASQGGRSGEPWKALSPEWARRRRGGGILVGRSGRLRTSLIRQRARGSVRRVTVRPGRTSGVEMGTTQKLAHLHQGGTTDRYVRTYRGKPLAKPRYAGRLPARPVVAITERDQQRWRGILADHLLGAKSLGL